MSQLPDSHFKCMFGLIREDSRYFPCIAGNLVWRRVRSRLLPPPNPLMPQIDQSHRPRGLRFRLLGRRVQILPHFGDTFWLWPRTLDQSRDRLREKLCGSRDFAMSPPDHGSLPAKKFGCEIYVAKPPNRQNPNVRWLWK